MRPKFPCLKCGLCCKQLKNGCKHLTVDNLCTIYNERPLICDIEKIYDLHFSKSMSYNDYVILSLNYCIQFAAAAGDSELCMKLKDTLTTWRYENAN